VNALSEPVGDSRRVHRAERSVESVVARRSPWPALIDGHAFVDSLGHSDESCRPLSIAGWSVITCYFDTCPFFTSECLTESVSSPPNPGI
jgi:hypothetical protein